MAVFVSRNESSDRLLDGGGGTLLDPELFDIRDSSGTEIVDTGNDDVDADNDIYDSQIIYTPTTAGTYYVVAGRAADDPGTYTLSVREVACTLNDGDIWCGVVTVGEYVSGGLTFAYGFVDATTDTGALSDTTFDVSPNSYTIDRASVGVGGNAGLLIFSLTSALTEADRAKLVLHVDGSSGSFAFAGVTPTATFGYRWDMSGLDWSSETPVTLRLRDTPAASTDATLIALSLGTGVTLSPAFASDTYAYAASVANDVEEVTVTPVTTNIGATFEYLDSFDAALADADSTEDGHQVDLDVGDTVFKVKVTAEDDTTTQTYTVTVTRAACVLETDDYWCGVVTVGDILASGSLWAHGYINVTGATGGTFVGELGVVGDGHPPHQHRAAVRQCVAVELDRGVAPLRLRGGPEEMGLSRPAEVLRA